MSLTPLVLTLGLFIEDVNTKQIRAIPQEEVNKLGITKPKQHPDVHIPVEEFIKKFGGNK